MASPTRRQLEVALEQIQVMSEIAQQASVLACLRSARGSRLTVAVRRWMAATRDLLADHVASTLLARIAEVQSALANERLAHAEAAYTLESRGARAVRWVDVANGGGARRSRT
jgi:hypothetical protein